MISLPPKHDYLLPFIVAVLINLTAISPFFIVVWLAEFRP
jgi:hypothetical protein